MIIWDVDMYESEANNIIASLGEIPAEVVTCFAESRQTVIKRTLIPWGEHCTECVYPTCYQTCDLYIPRADGKCRRFLDGMVRMDCPESLNGYVLRIKFRRWGKLSSMASPRLHSLHSADRAERRDQALARCIQIVPWPTLKRTLTHKRHSIKQYFAMRDSRSQEAANCFLVECYNPNTQSVALTLTMRHHESSIPFQSLLVMQPGFSRRRIPVSDIERVISLESHLHLELTPNNIAEGTTLFFGAIDFVLDRSFMPAPAEPAASKEQAQERFCKCVVWDLDNTLWEGTLSEDGPENIRLKPAICSILQQLDGRGILVSAVSKNNYDEAIATLRHLGIADYFLSPQISWDPKSVGIQQIAKSLNIGIDSLLFVDDSRFEREQVKTACPEVMVLDAAQYLTILERPDCLLPVTDEGKKRRLFYHQQQVRESAHKTFDGHYLTFLHDCKLRLTIRVMTETNLDRVHELTQRTNQMNFSGNRYTRERLQKFLVNPGIDSYVLDCEDRFGSYGTIGFCLITRAENRMTDLMFSCRIQAKQVEHAFLCYLIRKYRQNGSGDFFANYRKTIKNAGPGKVFDDFAFQVTGESDGVTQLLFPRSSPLPDDGVVTIEDMTGEPYFRLDGGLPVAEAFRTR